MLTHFRGIVRVRLPYEFIHGGGDQSDGLHPNTSGAALIASRFPLLYRSGVRAQLRLDVSQNLINLAAGVRVIGFASQSLLPGCDRARPTYAKWNEHAL